MSQQSTEARAKPGQFWMPKRGRSGMWRTVLEVSEAGVTWTTSRGEKGFTRWAAWLVQMEPVNAE